MINLSFPVTTTLREGAFWSSNSKNVNKINWRKDLNAPMIKLSRVGLSGNLLSSLLIKKVTKAVQTKLSENQHFNGYLLTASCSCDKNMSSKCKLLMWKIRHPSECQEKMKRSFLFTVLGPDHMNSTTKCMLQSRIRWIWIYIALYDRSTSSSIGLVYLVDLHSLCFSSFQ